MKSMFLSCFVILFVFSGSFANENPARFLSDPAISPDGEQIVFSYESDLWKVSVDGGTAYRLTAMDGREFLPRFSPDGRWIAFSATMDGNTNVYIMPANGGEINQLTFHQAADMVDSWSWDSKHIYFHSSRENMSSIYKIPLEGGTPKRLFDHYFNVPHHVVEHPLTGGYVFTESWESLNQPQRKRYRGANRPDLLYYNPEEDVFEQLTDFEGKDLWPTIDQRGHIYFVSDEANMEYNLYALRDGQKVALTSFDTSIGRPQVSANGAKIAFEKDYQLYIYDTATGQASTPEISLFQKNTLPLEQSFEVRGNITWFDVSPDHKKLAFVSRGELFVSDLEGKFIRQIPTNQAERVTEVAWSADNETLVYIQTRDGWANLYMIRADGRGEEIELESVDATSRFLSMDPDRKKGVYLSGRKHVKVVDIEQKTTETIAVAELWGFHNSRPRFSPDGRYILFTAYTNFEHNIYVHNLQNGESLQLTRTGMSERMPYWSPCGKYIYFAADRYMHNFPRSNTSDRLYRIPLYRFSDPMKSDEFDRLFTGNNERNGNGDNAIEIKIDMHNIDRRWESVGVSNIGRQWAPHVFKHGGNQVMFFTSNHDKGQWALWRLDQKPFDSSRPIKVDGTSPGMNLHMVEVNNNFYVLAGGNIHKVNMNQNRLDAIDIRHSFARNLRDEFNQIFMETWAALDENFYEEGFHGVDWQAERERFSQHLPHVRTRENLRRLINDMLGELNSSHTGFSSSGSEERSFYSARTAETGLIFDPDHPFRVDRVIHESHLDLSHETVRPGDVIVSVNGREIDQALNRDKYFYFSHMPEELELVFLRGQEKVIVKTRPHTPGQISTLLYDEWIAANRRYVEEQTDGRVGYVFMKDMSAGSLNQFIIDMTTHAMDKEALIFDIRFNRGGNVHDDVLQFLAQRPYLTWKYRGGSLSPQPNFAPSGNPMVMLINERSLSDAEMTAAGFRELELGTIIGTETYRWIIFTSSKSMVDGSSTRLPSWGCYTLEGENLELTGVAPDIDVYNSFHDRLRGIDPQLDRAIREVLKD